MHITIGLVPTTSEQSACGSVPAPVDFDLIRRHSSTSSFGEDPKVIHDTLGRVQAFASSMGITLAECSASLGCCPDYDPDT